MKITKLAPIGEFILVKPVEIQDVSAGGIILPGKAREEALQGEVLDVGEGYRNNDNVLLPLRVKVGDIILYALHSGTEFEDMVAWHPPLSPTGHYELIPKILLMRERDIYAIIKESIPDSAVVRPEKKVIQNAEPLSREEIMKQREETNAIKENARQSDKRDGISEIIEAGKMPATRVR